MALTIEQVFTSGKPFYEVIKDDKGGGAFFVEYTKRASNNLERYLKESFDCKGIAYEALIETERLYKNKIQDEVLLAPENYLNKTFKWVCIKIIERDLFSISDRARSRALQKHVRTKMSLGDSEFDAENSFEFGFSTEGIGNDIFSLEASKIISLENSENKKETEINILDPIDVASLSFEGVSQDEIEKADILQKIIEACLKKLKEYNFILHDIYTLKAKGLGNKTNESASVDLQFKTRNKIGKERFRQLYHKANKYMKNCVSTNYI